MCSKPLTRRRGRCDNDPVLRIHWPEGAHHHDKGGQRLYGSDAVERLSFIRRARDLGFPVDSNRDLIALRTTPDADYAAIDAKAWSVHVKAVRLQPAQSLPASQTMTSARAVAKVLATWCCNFSYTPLTL